MVDFDGVGCCAFSLCFSLPGEDGRCYGANRPNQLLYFSSRRSFSVDCLNLLYFGKLNLYRQCFEVSLR